MTNQEKSLKIEEQGGTCPDENIILVAIRPEKNPINVLQELCLKLNWPFPVYSDHATEGPAHARTFVMACSVGQRTTLGSGSTKKSAKREAAQKMVVLLKDGDKVAPVEEVEADKKAAAQAKALVSLKVNSNVNDMMPAERDALTADPTTRKSYSPVRDTVKEDHNVPEKWEKVKNNEIRHSRGRGRIRHPFPLRPSRPLRQENNGRHRQENHGLSPPQLKNQIRTVLDVDSSNSQIRVEINNDKKGIVVNKERMTDESSEEEDNNYCILFENIKDFDPDTVIEAPVSEVPPPELFLPAAPSPPALIPDNNSQDSFCDADSTVSSILSQFNFHPEMDFTVPPPPIIPGPMKARRPNGHFMHSPPQAFCPPNPPFLHHPTNPERTSPELGHSKPQFTPDQEQAFYFDPHHASINQMAQALEALTSESESEHSTASFSNGYQPEFDQPEPMPTQTYPRPILGREHSNLPKKRDLAPPTVRKSLCQARMEAARNDSSHKYSRSKYMAQQSGTVEVLSNPMFSAMDFREKDRLAAIAAAADKAEEESRILEQKKAYLERSLEQAKSENFLIEQKLVQLSMQ